MAAKTFCNSWSHKLGRKKPASYSFFEIFISPGGVGMKKFAEKKNDGH